ncbi:MAG TPA: ATP-binding protein [Thermoanaerobaculia bacterium]
MASFRDLPIRRKLTVIIMATSSAALLLACSAFVLHDLMSFRRLLLGDLSTLAKIIGSNSTGAILFDDAGRAEETLAALEAETHVLWACIYDGDGRRMAGYVRGGGTMEFPAAPKAPWHRFAGGRLRLSTPIVLDGEKIGTILLESDLGEIRERLVRYVGIGALVLLASSLVALLLSSKLQRVISEPILRLAQTARAVSERKDFSVRAGEAPHDDELGLLVGAFNEMLEQIEKAQKSLVERTREVERINRELARSNRELESFASVASHDLQEPLRKITAFGDRLKSQCDEALSDKGRDYLERMQNAATRMQSLIDDLLAYSRVTTRGQPFVPVSLAAVTQGVLSDLELRIERTGARIEVGDLPTIAADPTQMRQLFQNLLSNALKFQRPGEAPRIRVEARKLDGRSHDQPEGTPPGRNGSAAIQIRVQDNGIGFDEKYLDRLFKPFQRLHGQSAYEGTGIGLAICKKIAERHGGSITARSAPGQGTCFLVELPVQPSRGDAS